MSHGFIDRSCRLSSPVHRVEARIKILLALSFLILVVSTPPHHLVSFALFGGGLLWIVALSQVSLRGLALRAMAVLPFSIFAALGLPFMRGGEVVSVAGIAVSIGGLWLLWGAFVKSLLGAAAMILLVATTTFAALLEGLRQLGVPRFFIDLLAMTYRYIFLLMDEAGRLKRAAAARGFKPKILPQAVIVGRLTGNLFLRSYERAERVYGAMRLRGYGGAMPSGPRSLVPAPQKRAALALLALMIAVRVWGA